MTTTIQNVIKNSKDVTIKVPKKLAMHVALFIMTSARKNYASMAFSNNISYAQVRIKEKDTEELISLCSNFLINQIKSRSTDANKGFLIIDFTFLMKSFSQEISNITYDYDGVTKRVSKGFSAGFVFWSDGTILIPFNYNLWLRKKDAGDLYKKKVEIAKDIIKAAKNNAIPFAEVRMDGAFSSIEMLTFLREENIHFTMRIANNRVIITENGTDNLITHPDLQMKKNQKYKTVYASFKGVSYYFTAHKRKTKNNKHEIVFIISDLKRIPKEHVQAYKQRWPGEKFFRTGKQHIGLRDCQSIDAKKQRVHIFFVMVAYSVLQFIRIDKKKHSIEEVLHPIRHQKLYNIISQYIDLEKTFMN